MKNQTKTYDIKKVKLSALKQYESAGIFDENDLDWLIACSLKKNKTEYQMLKTIDKKQYQKIQRALKKRLIHMPISKIFHNVNFYGRDFFVNNNVLSPRNETEILTEQAIKLLQNKPNLTVLDLCCGSGAIGITVKKEMPLSQVTCLDISPKALYVTRKNAKKLDAMVKIIKSDMFNALKQKQKYDIIISNPPYIKSDELNNLDLEVKNFDPIISLDGKKSGLEFYEQIAEQANKYLIPGGFLILEVGYNQAKIVKKMLETKFSDVKIIKDYNNIERVVIATF